MMTRHAHMETEDKKGLGHAFFRLSSWYYFAMLFPTMRMRVRCSLWTWLWNSLEKGAASMPGGLAKHMRNSPMQARNKRKRKRASIFQSTYTLLSSR